MSSHTLKRARRSVSSADELQPSRLDSASTPALTHSPSLASTAHSNASSSSSSSSSSAFRNVSACNRCRVRKNRCDQNLPACSQCEKVGAKCTGFDPITKREIPRTYVYYLESRISYLEGLLIGHGIKFGSPEEFDLGAIPVRDQSRSHDTHNAHRRFFKNASSGSAKTSPSHKPNEAEKLDKLVSNIGMVSVHGTSDPRFLGSTSGISFARVVLAAVKSSLPSGSTGKKNGSKVRPGATAVTANAPSMRGMPSAMVWTW